MALPFFNWSRTASSNSTADSTINWAEGQLPSTVNDSARAMMASTAAFRDDIAGAITTGGSATAYTVTSYQVFDTLAHLNGQMIAFVPHATNTNAVGVDVTLNVDGLGAKSIRMAPGIALPNGTLVLGTPYVVTYNNSDGVFYLQNMTNPYVVPLAAGFDFWGTTTPNSSFAFPAGQAISRTTYATLFSIMSTTYGTGDGSTTFNLPDKTGRISAMKEASATRLTTAGSGVDGATMGAVGGSQSSTLITANLAPYTPAGTNAAPTVLAGGQAGSAVSGAPASISVPATGANPVYQTSGFGSLTATAPAFTGTAQGGTSTPFTNAQPTIVCNYIIRIV
jgi:microcystin-dependent protein